MKPIILTALLLTVVAATTATAQEFSRTTIYQGSTPTAGKYAAEMASSYLGELTSIVAVSAVFLGIGVVAKLDMWDESSSWFRNTWLAALAPAIPVGSAWGACLAGRHYGWDGKLWASGLGGMVGLAGGAVLVLTGRKSQNSPFLGDLPLYLVASLLPPVGATIGYNLSRTPGSYGGRFLPGSVALGSVRGADGVAHPSLDVRLVNVRF